MSTITRIEPGQRMSNAVVHNGIVYLAGQVGEPGDGVAAQTRTILAEVDRLLALSGSDKTRILKAQIWLADIATFAEMRFTKFWMNNAWTCFRGAYKTIIAKAFSK